jgi:hypothetical protein
VQQGTALVERTHGDNSPTAEERQKFAEAEKTWRLGVEFAILEFQKQSREEAVMQLKELLDQQGQKLTEIRTMLVG